MERLEGFEPRTWFRRPVLYPLSYRRLTKDIIAYSLSLLNCVALKLNGSENISFDAAARTYLEGISEELMSAYKRELAHVYRMASAKRMLFIKRKGTH